MNTRFLLFLSLTSANLFLGCAPPPGGAQPPSRARSVEEGSAQQGPAAPAVATTAAPLTPAPVTSPPALASPSSRGAAPVAEEQRFELERTLLAERDPHRRRGAVDELAALPDSEDSLIRTLLSDADPLVRRWSALALERRPPSPTIEGGIRQALIGESDRAVRAVLERTLAGLESNRAALALR